MMEFEPGLPPSAASTTGQAQSTRAYGLPIGLALALLSFTLLVPVGLAAGPVREAEVLTIEADVVRLDLSRQTTEALGRARLRYGETELHADQVTADRASGKAEARGNLAIVQGERRLRGAQLECDFVKGEGSLANAQAEEQGVIIRGETIEFSPGRLVARRASFTTCDKPDPDYSLGAEEITLTASEEVPGKRPTSGRLTLDRARVTYRGRRLLTLPRYSVLVGELDRPTSSPFPASGFDREDGPYAQISYALGRPGDPAVGSLAYRYTSFRGIRGHATLERDLGPLQLGFGYVRREAPTDRELRPDDMTLGLASVMVNRAPEFRAALREQAIVGLLRVSAELLHGSYSETEEYTADIRARARRSSLSGLLSAAPYALSRGLSASHAIGWRRSVYSPGDELTIRLIRHSLTFEPRAGSRLSLSHVTRTGSGETPFLFDRVDIGRELFSEVRLGLASGWRLELADVYDLDVRRTRDMMLSVTRTVHCLDYTVGWRKARGSFFVGISLAPPSGRERTHDREGPTAADNRAS